MISLDADVQIVERARVLAAYVRVLPIDVDTFCARNAEIATTSSTDSKYFPLEQKRNPAVSTISYSSAPVSPAFVSSQYKTMQVVSLGKDIHGSV